jgi:hypothetical protein
VKETDRVAGVVRVDGNSRVSEHGLRPGRRDDDLLVRALDLVGERGDGSKLKFLLGVVAGDVEQRAAGELLLVDLRKSNGRGPASAQS